MTNLTDQPEILSPIQPRPRGWRLPKLRFIIAALLFLAATLNYIDRQALALLKPTIQEDLKIDDNDYANINNFFLTAYTIAYLLSGRLVDKWGPRISMSVFLAFWSVSNALTAFARSAASLGVFRFMLGLGEAGNWPASAKAVGEWFPAKERAIAIGFYTLGATLGATLAPLLVIHLGSNYGWRATFVVTGMLGLAWIVPWLLIYRSPKNHPRITDEELQLLEQSDAAEGAAALEFGEVTAPPSELQRWKLAFSFKAVWLLMFARMLTDPVWYFYQQWFPSYLKSDWHLGQKELAITWVIFLAADIGTLAGGFGSAFLIRRGSRAAPARMAVMLLCAMIVPLSPLITRMPTVGGAIAVAMIVVFAHLCWLANISALVVDVIPRSMLATCFGIAAAGSALGGIVMNKFVAHFATVHDYGTWYLVMAFLHPTAWLLLWAGGIRRRPTAAQPAPVA